VILERVHQRGDALGRARDAAEALGSVSDAWKRFGSPAEVRTGASRDPSAAQVEFRDRGD